MKLMKKTIYTVYDWWFNQNDFATVQVCSEVFAMSNSLECDEVWLLINIQVKACQKP